jgi:hypothetical protein
MIQTSNTDLSAMPMVTYLLTVRLKVDHSTLQLSSVVPSALRDPAILAEPDLIRLARRFPPESPQKIEGQRRTQVFLRAPDHFTTVSKGRRR